MGQRPRIFVKKLKLRNIGAEHRNIIQIEIVKILIGH